MHFSFGYTTNQSPTSLKEEARQSRFGQPVVHGILTASLFSFIFGTRLPGAVYVSQSLSFRAPVFFGEEIEAKIVVDKINPLKKFLHCSTTCTNSKGVQVIKGEAVVLVPQLLVADKESH